MEQTNQLQTQIQELRQQLTDLKSQTRNTKKMIGQLFGAGMLGGLMLFIPSFAGFSYYGLKGLFKLASKGYDHLKQQALIRNFQSDIATRVARNNLIDALKKPVIGGEEREIISEISKEAMIEVMPEIDRGEALRANPHVFSGPFPLAKGLIHYSPHDDSNFDLNEKERNKIARELGKMKGESIRDNQKNIGQIAVVKGRNDPNSHVKFIFEKLVERFGSKINHRVEDLLSKLDQIEQNGIQVLDSDGFFGVINENVLSVIDKKIENDQSLSEIELIIIELRDILLKNRDIYLNAFNQLVEGLKRIIVEVGRKPTDAELSEFLGFSNRYITSKRYEIKNDHKKNPIVVMDYFFRMEASTRIKLIRYSYENSVDLSEEVKLPSELFKMYKESVDYDILSDPINLALTKFEFSMAELFAELDPNIDSLGLDGLEGILGISLRRIRSGLSLGKSEGVYADKYATLKHALYNKYAKVFENIGLYDEFNRIFGILISEVSATNLIPEECIVSPRGLAIREIIKLFPPDYFISRNILSRVFTGDDYNLYNNFFNPNRIDSLPMDTTYTEMISQIQSFPNAILKDFEGNEYNAKEIKDKAIKALKFFRKEMASKYDTSPELVLGYYLEYLFGKEFVKARPSFMGGLELDRYNPELKIALEFQGPIHYFSGIWAEKYGIEIDEAKDKLFKRNINDLIKYIKCKDEGVVLIVISIFDNPKKHNWQHLICEQYKLWTGKLAPDKPVIPYEDVVRAVARGQYDYFLKLFERNFKY